MEYVETNRIDKFYTNNIAQVHTLTSPFPPTNYDIFKLF